MPAQRRKFLRHIHEPTFPFKLYVFTGGPSFANLIESEKIKTKSRPNSNTSYRLLIFGLWLAACRVSAVSSFIS